jgi:hypothetical protein
MADAVAPSSAPFFAAHIGGHDYLLDRLTLDELRVMELKYGLGQIEDFNPTNPSQLIGLLYLSLRREGVGEQAALEAVGRIDFMDVLSWMRSDAEATLAAVEQLVEESKEAERPTAASTKGGASKNGGSGKPRKKPGAGS